MMETPSHQISIPSAADVLEWLKANKSDNACPFCSNTAWTLSAGGANGVGGAIPIFMSDGSTHERHMRVLVLICAQCSFLRQHVYSDFESWYQKLKAMNQVSP